MIGSFLGHMSFHVISDEIVNLNEAIDLLVVISLDHLLFWVQIDEPHGDHLDEPF